MNDFMKDIVAIATAVIGLAIIATLVRYGTQTSNIITSSTSGFANVLSAAMGGGSTVAPM